MTYGLRARKSVITWKPGSKSSAGTSTNFPGTIKNYQPYTPDMIDGVRGVGAYAADGKRPGGRLMKMEFTEELRGAGADALTAGFGSPICALLRACGWNEAFSGSAGTKGATMYIGNPHFIDDSTYPGDTDPIDVTFTIDSRSLVGANCVGNAVITFEAGKIPVVDFDLTGQYSGAETEGAVQTITTATYMAKPAPWLAASIAVSSAATGAMTGGICKKIVIDTGAQVIARPDGSAASGYAIPRIAEFAPKLTMDLETVLLATYSWEAIFHNRELITVTWDHQGGSTSGADGVGLTCTFAGYLDNIPGREDANGILDNTLVLAIQPSSTTAKMEYAST